MPQISRATHDLISSGLHNLTADELHQFLALSPEVDGLRLASVHQLHQTKVLSDQDKPQGGTHHLRVGVYVCAEPMICHPSQTSVTPS